MEGRLPQSFRQEWLVSALATAIGVRLIVIRLCFTSLEMQLRWHKHEKCCPSAIQLQLDCNWTFVHLKKLVVGHCNWAAIRLQLDCDWTARAAARATARLMPLERVSVP